MCVFCYQTCTSEQITETRPQSSVIGLFDCYVQYVHQFLLHFVLLEGKHRPEKSVNTRLCDGRSQLPKSHKLVEKESFHKHRSRCEQWTIERLFKPWGGFKKWHVQNSLHAMWCTVDNQMEDLRWVKQKELKGHKWSAKQKNSCSDTKQEGRLRTRFSK